MLCKGVMLDVQEHQPYRPVKPGSARATPAGVAMSMMAVHHEGGSYMKKVSSVLVVVCLILSLLAGVVALIPGARADTFGDYIYTVSGGKATITGYTGPGGVAVLPSMLGGYPVTAIGGNAFTSTQGYLLTDVTIPNGVTSIGSYAFYKSTALSNVTIPNSVSAVGEGVFYYCTALTSVAIPNSVTSIGTNSFQGCIALTSLTIGSGLTSIGRGLFANCEKLTSITIPNSVTSVDDHAFQECRALACVVIPNGVPSIGRYAFQECVALTSVTIPNSVTSIGSCAFQKCVALTSVTIPNGATTIGERAFDSCAKLVEAYFLGNAPTMGANVFASCAPGFTVWHIDGTTGWTNPWYGYPASAFSGAAYTLTPSAGTGGAITPNTPQTVLQGGSATFGIAANTGYRIADVAVDGASQGNISSYTFTNVTSNHTIKAVFEKEREQTVLVLQVGKAAFTVNGVAKMLDSPPVIKNGRTLVPIRAIIEALGGTVGWDGTARKATVTLGSAAVELWIELWIGKSAAKVNGVSTLIDPANAKVVPEIINGRTMLPVRFVSENLGCSVLWADATKTITITYEGQG